MYGLDEVIAAAPWVYAGLAAVTLLDVCVPVLPAETSVITGGVLASTGRLHLLLVVAVAVAGAWTGDALAYRAGRALERRRSRHRPLAPAAARREPAALRRLRGALAARQGRVLVLARFVPGGRTVVCFAAGSMRYPAGRFLRHTLLASVLWASLAATLGYAGGQAFDGRLWLAVVVSKTTAACLLGLLELAHRVLPPRPPRSAVTRRPAPPPTPESLPAAQVES
ncbi:DedA family protein [Streptomyces sp. NPDC000658]|uniref:DedA family protein n=1 Tax=Streptomyces sp. NPDC000658 TaxID=3154266 RepID=UPI003333C673